MYILAWILGEFMCKLVTYLQGVSVSASVNTLVAISIERFLSICHPLNYIITTHICVYIVVLAWVLAFILTLPWAVVFKVRTLEISNIEVGRNMKTCLRK